MRACDFYKGETSWKMGSGPGSPFGLEDKAPPEPPGCLSLEDLQTRLGRFYGKTEK